ncbi:MAG: 1-deoxy-D-xylulose-5-phosphate reductoisomerase [Clostridia bacterium]
MKKISLLGSTGSIGVQATSVVRTHLDKFEIVGLAAYSNIVLLEKQVREFKPQLVAVFDLEAANSLKINISDTETKVVSGINGLCEVACIESADIVLNSVIGMIGLRPTLAAIEAGKDIALANKETLVTGGQLVMSKAKEKGVKILPVDSEHSAIFQCLQGLHDSKELNRVIVTASGGPFFGKDIDFLKTVTPQMALKHPNWEMGAKITIDSATMMNKGLELMEAKWLFDLNPSQIDVLVHRESVIHSLVEFTDNSVIAQLGVPDMKIPIQYALTYPNRFACDVKKLDLWQWKNLSFFEADEHTFKCLASSKEAMIRGGLAPTAINGADEEAVRLFLENKISFTDIAELVKAAMDNQKDVDSFNLEDILNADITARKFVLNNI